MTLQSQQAPSGRTASPPPASPPARQSPSRLPFWAGFGLSFVLLGILSVGILFLSVGIDRADLANLQSGEAAWTPPEIIPTATLDASTVNASAAGAGENYALGSPLRNITNGGVFIRQTPGYLGKLESDKIGRIAAGGTVEIIGGPATADDLRWWQVRYRAGDGTIVEGWSAQATASGLQILGPAQ